jgi:hypothetical protein
MKIRNLVHSLLVASAGYLALTAQASDLADVYQRALQNDPQIREAEANRLAAMERKPQARSALLPQVEANAGYQDRESDGSSVFVTTIDGELRPLTRLTEADTETETWDVTLRQSIFRWENWANLRRADRRGRAGGSGLPGRAAAADPQDLGGLLQRARRQGHPDGCRGRARGLPPPARAGREALRGRPHRDHRRPGGPGCLRFRDGGDDPRQAQPREPAGGPARTHWRNLRRAGAPERQGPAGGPGPRGRG